MTIRPASERDLEALLGLVRAYRVFYRQEPNEAREREFVLFQLQNPSSALFLADVEGAPAGFVQLFRTYSTVHLANAFILEDLYVDSAYRKRGIAAALLERALQHARENGAAGMFLETANDNTTAQRVYERAGWTREARFFKYNAPL